MAGKKGTVKGAQDALNEVMAQLDPGLANSPELLINRPSFVPENLPVMADQNALSGLVNAAAAANPKLAALDPGTAKVLQDVEAAFSHNERLATVSTIVGVGNSSVVMPREARDVANALYYQIGVDNRMYYGREKADRLQKAIFGAELAETISHGAARNGFHHKPLLWVSQMLWQRLEIDMNDTVEPDEDYSDVGDAGITQALGLVFDGHTVRLIARAAKNHKASVLSTVRQLVKALCDQHGVRLPSEEDRQAWMDKQRESLRAL